MYHPTIVARKISALLSDPALAPIFPDGFPEYSVDDRRALTQQICSSREIDEDGRERILRHLDPEEDAFVSAAQLQVQVDATFYLETFVYIDEEGHGLRPLFPLWESQRFTLKRLAELELRHDRDGHPDGLLINILKARQLGLSTLAEALVSHRIFTQKHIRAIAGSDVEEQASYLVKMVERIYAHLPYFLQPGKVVPYRAGKELHLSNDSGVKAAWGKTTRGALQEVGGKKGNIERGRSQPLDEPVLTPYGWIPMGDLRVGDSVIGRDGRPTEIVGVFPQGPEPIYRVSFTDGSRTRCSGDHLWEITTAARRWSGQAPFVRTTTDLLAGGLYWNKPSGRMAKWFIPTVAPVEYAPIDLPIPAYTLGAYLGDGSTRSGGLQFSCRDPEIKTRVAAELPDNLIVGVKEYNHSWYVRAANRSAAKTTHTYLQALTSLGLRGKGSAEKFIPTRYRMAPIADRIALLQGLMDTDGTASRSEGKINFSTVSPQLAADFQELVESLGGIARVSKHPPKKAHIRSNGQRVEGKHPYYVFSLCLPEGIIPFHLPRKIDQLTPGDQRKYFPSRAIVAIEPEGLTETQCIRVAATDQLYVTRRFVVTHNTNSVVHISELATWDNPEQLDTALLPGVPVNADSLVIFESTAELAGDWWHLHYQACEDGTTPRDWSNVFVPWCVEPGKYSLPAPVGWVPTEQTLKVARQIEAEMPRYVGESITLNRNQLFWYETTRAYYAKKNRVYDFFKEYPSNPRECVAGTTRVCTDQGLIPIADAQGVHHVESGRVVNWWPRGVRPTFRVRTTAGREFSATADHPVALTDGRWVNTAHLQPGDQLVLAPPQFLVRDLYRAQWEWAPCCAMEVLVTEDVGRLLGFWIGDGSWGKDCLDIACSGRDLDAVAEVARLCQSLIGRPTVQRTIGGCVSVRSTSVRWKEIWRQLGLLEPTNGTTKAGYRKRLRIPECIWRSPKSVVAAFLSGLFESDGHANKAAPQISLFSKSEDLIREVQLLLLGFGINAEYRTVVKHHRGKTYTGRYLRLNAENASIFHREIGFVSVRKQRGGRPRATGGRGRRALPVSMTDVMLSVIPDSVQAVYDLAVSPTHFFGANGIRVHNCFQYAGRSVFSHEAMEAIDQAARPLLDVWRVEPSFEIAALRREGDLSHSPSPLAVALKADKRPAAPAVVRPISPSAMNYAIPPGYGFRRLSQDELDELPTLRSSVLAIWEYPRPRGRRRYIMGVDVGDGVAQDYSVITIVRESTLEEIMEDVAQFVTNTLKPSQLAYVCDAIGRLYCDEDGIEAMAAIELNNHGAVVQDLLQLHLGYTNFYVWEVVDAAQSEARFTKRIGWTTTTRTRPILLEKFNDLVTTVDAISNLADFRINSPITRSEMRFFVTETTLGEAEHAKGQHDDAIFASSIAGLVAHRMSGGETEPIAERRRRRDTLKAQQARLGSAFIRRDFRNTDATADQQDQAGDDGEDDDSSPDDLYFSPRNSA